MKGVKRVLTEEEKHLALSMAYEGRTQQAICDTLVMDSMTFWNIRERDPDFERDYQKLRRESIDGMVDTLKTVTDGYIDVNVARLKSENIRWIAERMKPETYGQRLDINVKTLDITPLLSRAEARIAIGIEPQSAPVLHQSDSRNAQVFGPTGENAGLDTNLKLVLTPDEQLSELLK